MIYENFEFRLAIKEDFEDFLSLKIEPNNIYWSGFDCAPKIERLRTHFISAIDSDLRDFYLLFDISRAIGYLYIDYDPEERVSEIAYGITQKMSGRGLAKLMIKKGLTNLRPNYHSVIAWIALSNIPSIKTVEGLGFHRTNMEESRTFAQECDPVRFQKFIKAFFAAYES